MVRKILYAAVALVAFACSAQRSGDVPLPSVPSELREPQVRADYIIEHFWDNADTLGAYKRNALEQAFSNFISVFPVASDTARQKAMKALVQKASSGHDGLVAVAEIADIYLYNVDSPIASEEYYILFLQELMESDALSEDEKIRPAYQLSNALRNRPGDLAADFSFDTREGLHTSLYDEIDRLASGQKLALIFYDPDCSHCRKLLDKLLKYRADFAGLTFVAVYSGDDRPMWQDAAGELPSDWIVGYDDGTMQEEDTYIIRTLPTIYVIAPDKTVLVKEATLDDLLDQ